MSREIDLREAAIEFDGLETLMRETEQKFSFQDKNLVDLSKDIWQILGKATNLASKLWTLGLNELAEQVESCKLRLAQMHSHLSAEMNEV
jgi:hypothetical protein